MRLLDLFCGAGGAAEGYRRAGFDEIIGVDIAQQRHYPFRFVKGDALQVLGWMQKHEGRFPIDHPDGRREWLGPFDVVHASPPCQRYTSMKTMWNHKGAAHPDLVDPVRTYLQQLTVEYVIENVPGAPLHKPVRLCGTAFSLGVQVDGKPFQLRRHRLFESSIPLTGVVCQHGSHTIGLYGDHARKRRGVDFSGAPTIGIYGAVPHGREPKRNFSHTGKLALGALAMDMPWAGVWKEVCEAIPPAYTEYIGHQLLVQIQQQQQGIA